MSCMRAAVVGLLVLGSALPSYAGDAEDGGWSYDDGLRFRTKDDKFELRVGTMAQFRLTEPDANPRSYRSPRATRPFLPPVALHFAVRHGRILEIRAIRKDHPDHHAVAPHHGGGGRGEES